MKHILSLNEYHEYKMKNRFNEVLIAIRNGEATIEDFNIPILPRELSGIFNQLASTINELTINGIYCEVTNPDNYGIKQNGNIGIFDLGFGDYFTTTNDVVKEIEITGNPLDSIKNYFGIGTLNYIDSGMFGHAHVTDDGRILKLTKDHTEASNCLKIKGKKNNHIADIYDVAKFKMRGVEHFAILQEKLDTTAIDFDVAFKKISSAFENSLNRHLDASTVDKIEKRNPVLGSLLRSIVDNGYELGWKNWLETNGNEVNDIPDNADTNDMTDISEWIKGSKSNFNYIEEIVPEHVKKLVKKYSNNFFF